MTELNAKSEVEVVTGQSGDRVLLAIGYMCLAVSLFPFLNASVKYLSHLYSPIEIVWARYFGHLIYMLMLFGPSRRLGLFRTAAPWMQIGRSMLLLGSTSFYFIALSAIPLATAAAINFIGPIILTAMSVPFLGEKVGPRRWAAVLIGFIGALVIIRPGFGRTDWHAIAVLGSATCYCFYSILSRKLAARDSAETSITYIALVGVLATTVLLPFGWRLPDNWHDLVLFIGLGFFGGVGHYFVVQAYRYGPASLLSPFGYGQLIGATILGFVVFGDFPDHWTWVGASIIIASGLYITYRESRMAKPAR